MAIPIDADFLLDLIKRRWDSVDEFAVGWEERCRSRLQKVGEPRDRATIYRWLKLGLPNRREEVMGLCATLDVDPLALVDLDSGAFIKLFERERQLFLLNQPIRSRLSVLWPLIRPSPHWPDFGIGHDYFARPWSLFEFEHPARDIVNVFAQIRLHDRAEPEAAEPVRVYHFAYRKAGALDRLWRPYGIVRRRGNQVIAVAEMGWRDMRSPDPEGVIDAETFFGPGPASFRIASLHAFDAEIIAPSQAVAAVRFPA